MTSLICLLFLTMLPHLVHGDNQDGGFCSLRSMGHFPLPPPDPHIPWIWDATVSRSGRRVEATAISRNACRFDRKLWQKLVKTYPEYAQQLGEGLESNILAPVVPGYDYIRVNPSLKGEQKKGLQMNTVICVFLLDEVVVARSSSLKILDVEIAELSSIQIRCPIPEHLLDKNASWNEMKIERRLSPNPKHKELHLPNSTESFRVCNMHRLRKPLLCSSGIHCERKSSNIINRTYLRSSSKSSRTNKRDVTVQNYDYKLSLCTATSRSSRDRLVEWIEYHKLLGVEHFYLYDTNPRDTPISNTLAYVLADYIYMGSVSVVRWPYENCVRKMASGRKVLVSSPFKAVFMPPRAISQTAALASCYSRNKEYSEWMIHIDDDEFLGFSPTARFGGVKVQNLHELVDQISKKDPLTNAVSFYPLCVHDCREYSHSNQSVQAKSMHGVLPRYGLWDMGKFCPFYEIKLIMRTAAIGMFFTHYITLRETPTRISNNPQGDGPIINFNREPTQLSRKDAAVLHFKDIVVDKSASIFGAALPVNPDARRMECTATPEKKENVTATKVLQSLTELALPYLERNYMSQLTEVYAFRT